MDSGNLPIGEMNIWTVGGSIEMYGSSRNCKHPNCGAGVPFRYKDSGYCNRKYGAHWNESEATYDRPKCECGADSTKSHRNPHPKHSTWCKVSDWEKN